MAIMASSFFTAHYISYKVKKKRRKLFVAVVVSVREVSYSMELRIPFAPYDRAVIKRYIITASHQRQSFQFIDHSPREVNDRIIILTNHRGKVLAVSRKDVKEDLKILNMLVA